MSKLSTSSTQARLSDGIRQTRLCSSFKYGVGLARLLISEFIPYLSSLQIVYYTGLWVFLLNYGSERVWTANMFCVQSGVPLLKWLGDSTGILLHHIMVEPH